MSKPIIRSYKDLLLEQERLRNQLQLQKQTLNEQVQAVKEKLAPIGKVLGIVSGIAAAGAKNPLISSGVGLAVDMFIKKRLFKKSGLITGLVSSFLLRGVASKVLAGAAGAVIGKLFKKKDPKAPHPAKQE
jgi:hypothetical protein